MSRKGKGNTPRAHHWIPQGYLRQFTDQRGRVQVCEKATGKVFTVAPSEIAHQRDFYSWRQDDELDASVETFLANQYDNQLAPLLRLLPAAITHLPDRIVEHVRAPLNTLTALQLIRTPRIRRQLLQAAQAEVGQPGITYTETELSTGAHLKMLRETTIPRMAQHFGTLHSALLVAPPDALFLTSDHPVCTYRETGHNGKVTFMPSTGIAEDGFQLIYPLTPRVAYVLTQRRINLSPRRLGTLKPLGIQDINRLIWKNAAVHVYSSQPFGALGNLADPASS